MDKLKKVVIGKKVKDTNSFLTNTLGNLALDVIQNRVRQNKRSLPEIISGYVALIREFFKEKNYAERDNYKSPTCEIHKEGNRKANSEELIP